MIDTKMNLIPLVLEHSADFFYNISFFPAKALDSEPDKTFYLAYDLYAKTHPDYYDDDYYSFDDITGGNKVRTPQINNITLQVNLNLKYPLTSLFVREQRSNC